MKRNVLRLTGVKPPRGGIKTHAALTKRLPPLWIKNTHKLLLPWVEVTHGFQSALSLKSPPASEIWRQGTRCSLEDVGRGLRDVRTDRSCYKVRKVNFERSRTEAALLPQRNWWQSLVAMANHVTSLPTGLVSTYRFPLTATRTRPSQTNDLYTSVSFSLRAPTASVG